MGFTEGLPAAIQCPPHTKTLRSATLAPTCSGRIHCSFGPQPRMRQLGNQDAFLDRGFGSGMKRDSITTPISTVCMSNSSEALGQITREVSDGLNIDLIRRGLRHRRCVETFRSLQASGRITFDSFMRTATEPVLAESHPYSIRLGCVL